MVSSFIDDKEKIILVSAEDELKAMDQVFEEYNKKHPIGDIKIV